MPFCNHCNKEVPMDELVSHIVNEKVREDFNTQFAPKIRQAGQEKQGFFSRIRAFFVYSPKPPEMLECRTCHNIYLGNIHKKMPHAICDGCLDISLSATKLIGDSELYAAMEWEFDRRKAAK